MESNCTRQFQSKDDDPSCSTSVCLRTPLILRTVMQDLTGKELLQCSLVNKQWNYEARTVMRARGTLIAKLTRSHRICRRLYHFASDLEKMNVVPFSGMAIHIFAPDLYEHRQRRQPTTSPTLSPLYNVILERVDWKYFSISFHEEWMRCSRWNCQSFLLAQKILKDFSGVFQVLEFDPPDTRWNSIEPILQGCTFPCLKTLKIRSFRSPLDEAQKMFIKTVAARSPNLEQVQLRAFTDLSENLLEGTSGVVLQVDSLTDPVKDQICDELIGALRLNQMKLNFDRSSFSLERFDRIVPEVLQTSRTALKTLHLNLAFLVKLMCYGICLENVTDLKIFVNNRHRKSAFLRVCTLRLLTAFDLTRTFPSLNKVNVYRCQGNFFHSDIKRIVEQGNAAWKEPLPDRAVNIKFVRFTYLSTIPSFFASMFPHTEKLEVILFKGPTFSYGSIWKHWAHLKEFHIRIKKSFFNRVRHEEEQKSGWENVDSFFCGIFPEEVAELREQDEEFLSTVNIVPIMPSITCMKALTTLKLILRGSGCFPGKNDPTFIFSKVTGLVAFARCPNLSVVIDTHMEWEKALSHMKNYASLVYY